MVIVHGSNEDFDLCRVCNARFRQDERQLAEIVKQCPELSISAIKEFVLHTEWSLFDVLNFVAVFRRLPEGVSVVEGRAMVQAIQTMVDVTVAPLKVMEDRLSLPPKSDESMRWQQRRGKRWWQK